MKYKMSFALLLCFCLLAEAGKTQMANADTMIHKLFASLQAKSEKAYVALYPNDAQFTNMIRYIIRDGVNTDEIKRTLEMNTKSKDINIDSLINAVVDRQINPETIAAMRKNLSKRFQETIAQGEKKGVNWSKARLITYSVDTTVVSTKPSKMFQPTGIKTMKGVIDFIAGDSSYRMSFKNLIYIPTESGWFGGEVEELIRKGETFAADIVPEESENKIYEWPSTPVQKSKAKSKQ